MNLDEPEEVRLDRDRLNIELKEMVERVVAVKEKKIAESFHPCQEAKSYEDFIKQNNCCGCCRPKE